MEIGLGILIGICLVGVIRLLELKYSVTTETIERTIRPHQKGEIILPQITADDLADRYADTQEAI